MPRHTFACIPGRKKSTVPAIETTSPKACHRVGFSFSHSRLPSRIRIGINPIRKETVVDGTTCRAMKKEPLPTR